jgi:hypothetical protein
MAHTHGRSWLALLLVVLVALPVALDAQDAAPRFTRILGVGAEMTGRIQQGDAQSETFRALVDDIQQSNAIVVVQFGRCRDGRLRSCLVHVEGNASSRIVRILVDTRTARDRVMATIAHELHHAVELLRVPTVVDAAGVLRFYRGRAQGDCGRGLSEVCETEGALATEARVLDELRRSSRH